MRRVVMIGLVMFGLLPSAYASGLQERSATADPVLGGVVRESDVAAVFDYLREAMSAAMEGREAPAPDEITQRAEAMGNELKRRGAAAARALLDGIESRIREGMREPRRLPPAGPFYQRI